ncbi:MAG: gliding motility-associated C-terminal domain-containing protein, partial [Phaeodactylibacter sp.]|nr:gliding motility-associated C-terminal domain-containing protein [Phaeodactylibacter sp.]
VVGGTAPYQYQWVGPGGNTSSQQDITGLAGGIYVLTVQDATGDQVSIQVNVAEPSQPLTISEVTVECVSVQGACDGFIVIDEVTGGTPPYSYSWSNNQSGQTVTGLCVGTYFVTVEDANGCETTGSGTVCFTPPQMFLSNIPPQHVDCNGAATGTWTVEVDGGLPPYQFNFSDIGIVPSNDGSETRFNLPAGMYSCTVTDAFGQVQIANTTINEPPALQLTSIEILPTVDPGAHGEIDITMTGGTLPYTYQWSNGFGGPDPVNLVENCYTLTVVDGHDCLFFSDDICVPTLEVTNANVNDVFCENDADGSILLGIGGDLNQPVSYTWTGPNGPIAQDTNYLENLEPGIYTVVLTDALGATTQPLTLEIDYTSQVNLQATVAEDITCPGGSDGALIAAASNGEAPYDYEWCGGLGFDNLLMDVSAGVYLVIVTDAFGCTDTTDVVLEGPTAFQGPAEIKPDDACSEQPTGQISLSFSGGTGPYMYDWDDSQNQSTNPIIRLEGGVYTVTVTDDNGCTYMQSYDVPGADPLEILFNVTPDNGGGDGIATVVVSGGIQPYSYEWNIDRPDHNSSMITQLPTGEYSVLVTDATGCTIMGSVFVPDGRIDCLEYRNVITPDGDGMNETFLIQCLEEYETHHLEIYNRWGQLVYETDAYSNEWAGFNNKGAQVADGAYYFIFEYEDREGQRRQLKGHITLIR